MKTDKPYLTCSKADAGIMLELARCNRQNPTEAEKVLWEQLRNKFYGIKFRRQHVVNHYIVDFICLSHNLVIEVDGGYHQLAEQIQYDKERTAYLSTKGLTELRFSNEEVLLDIDNVLHKIKQYLIKELQ